MDPIGQLLIYHAFHSEAFPRMKRLQIMHVSSYVAVNFKNFCARLPSISIASFILEQVITLVQVAGSQARTLLMIELVDAQNDQSAKGMNNL